MGDGKDYLKRLPWNRSQGIGCETARQGICRAAEGCRPEAGLTLLSVDRVNRPADTGWRRWR